MISTFWKDNYNHLDSFAVSFGDIPSIPTITGMSIVKVPNGPTFSFALSVRSLRLSLQYLLLKVDLPHPRDEPQTHSQSPLTGNCVRCSLLQP